MIVSGFTLLVVTVILLRLPQKASAPASDRPPKSYTIEIWENGFFPAKAVVPKNTSVCWLNKDSKEHFPSADPSVSSFAFSPEGALQPGGMWCFPFSLPGVWSYGDKSDGALKGSLTVTEG